MGALQEEVTTGSGGVRQGWAWCRGEESGAHPSEPGRTCYTFRTFQAGKGQTEVCLICCLGCYEEPRMHWREEESCGASGRLPHRSSGELGGFCAWSGESRAREPLGGSWHVLGEEFWERRDWVDVCVGGRGRRRGQGWFSAFPTDEWMCHLVDGKMEKGRSKGLMTS